MKFMKIRAPDFDLEKTLESGQVFHWQKVGDGFVGAIDDLPVYVEQRGDLHELRRRSCAIASSAIAQKICMRRRGSSAPAKPISRLGRHSPIPSSENNCAHCQAWGRRLQIA